MSYSITFLLLVISLVQNSNSLSCKPCTQEDFAACTPISSMNCQVELVPCDCCPKCPLKRGQPCHALTPSCNKKLYCTLYIRGKAREQRTITPWYFMDYKGKCQKRKEKLPLNVDYNQWMKNLKKYRKLGYSKKGPFFTKKS